MRRVSVVSTQLILILFRVAFLYSLVLVVFLLLMLLLLSFT